MVYPLVSYNVTHVRGLGISDKCEKVQVHVKVSTFLPLLHCLKDGNVWHTVTVGRGPGEHTDALDLTRCQHGREPSLCEPCSQEPPKDPS